MSQPVTSTKSSEIVGTNYAASTEQEIIAPYYLRVKGKNITPDCPVYILGTMHEWPLEQYPKSVLRTLHNCQLLVTEFPRSLLGDTMQNIRTFNARVHLEIQRRLKAMDESWFRQQMTLLHYSPTLQAECLKLLKEKGEYPTEWQKRLPTAFQRNIQTHLNDYGLKLDELHPLIAETLLDIKITVRNYGSGGIEKALLEHFQSEHRSVVELDDLTLMEATFLGTFLRFLSHYDLDETLETLEHYCTELDTGEYSDEESTGRDIHEAYFSEERRLNLNQFKMDSDEEDRVRNLSWQPKLLTAIAQNQSTAIVMGSAHLQGPTGAIQFLESQGYTVELAY